MDRMDQKMEPIHSYENRSVVPWTYEELGIKKLTKVFWYMSEVSHYVTRPSHCPPEAILHYASRDWPTIQN